MENNLQVKMFSGSAYDDLEGIINKWLSKNNGTIKNIICTPGNHNSDVTITIWYYPLKTE